MRILAHVQRPGRALARPIFANGLRNRENMRFGKRAVLGSAAMPAGAEGDKLLRIAEIRRALVIIADEAIDVDEQFAGHRLTGERRVGHRRGLRRAWAEVGLWRRAAGARLG